jgi:hypothetical protein
MRNIVHAQRGQKALRRVPVQVQHIKKIRHPKILQVPPIQKVRPLRPKMVVDIHQQKMQYQNHHQKLHHRLLRQRRIHRLEEGMEDQAVLVKEANMAELEEEHKEKMVRFDFNELLRFGKIIAQI